MISDCGKRLGHVEEQAQHTEAQMIGALKQLEAGRKVEDVAREVGVSKHTIYARKAKYGGMDVSEAQEAKQLRDENTKLKKLVVDLSLDKEMLKAVIARNGWSSYRVEKQAVVRGDWPRTGQRADTILNLSSKGFQTSSRPSTTSLAVSHGRMPTGYRG
jgi:putative transposase